MACFWVPSHMPMIYALHQLANPADTEAQLHLVQSYTEKRGLSLFAQKNVEL